jgi:uncharacterized membrane protein YgaE (UPF0421/DUF939 family)
MTNNKQQTNPENPNNQFSNSEPMTFTQKVEYVKSIDMTNNKQQTEMNAVEYLDKVNQFAKENNTGKPRQQTAIEWLFDNVYMAHSELSEKLKQAKEMEKERIIDAHYEGQCNQTEGYPLQIAEQYYNETYGGNK